MSIGFIIKQFTLREISKFANSIHIFYIIRERITKFDNTMQRSITSFFCSPQVKLSETNASKSSETKKKDVVKLEEITNKFTGRNTQREPSSPPSAGKRERSPECDKNQLSDDQDSPVKVTKRTNRKMRLSDSDEEMESLTPPGSKEISSIPHPLQSTPTCSREITSNSSASSADQSSEIPKRKTARKSITPLPSISSKAIKTASRTEISDAVDTDDSEPSDVPNNHDCTLVDERVESNIMDAKDSEEKSSTSSVVSSRGKQSSNSCTDISQGKAPHGKPGSESKSTLYDPTNSSYDPLNHATWKHGQRVPFSALAQTFSAIEETSGRLKMIATLSNYLRSVIILSPDDLVSSTYLSLNKLGPAYEGLELGIGDTVLLKALSQATGRNLDAIKKDLQVKGDLGLTAESCRSSQRMLFTPPPLTVQGVFCKLKEIAAMVGTASISKKVEIIKGLLVSCKGCETRYLIRLLSGKLRIGLAEQSVISALGSAVFLSPPQEFPPKILNSAELMSTEKAKAKSDETILTIKTTYCECPNFEKIIKTILEVGVEALPEHCKLTPGIPLKPMLAHPTKGIGEVLRRFENAEFTCEFKYDGERAQIHGLTDGSVQIYSRNAEDNTSKYPDIITLMPEILDENVSSYVIDAEAVAFDPIKQQILPFQVLSTRKRKDADSNSIKVQVCVYAFDLLYLNGEPLVRQPFRQRRKLLHSSFKEIAGQFHFVTSMTSSDTEEISDFVSESLKGNCEGIMVKTLDRDASYEIAKRSHNWLKVKKDYLEGIGDTLDVIVIGGFHGTGKRTGQYGGFLLACYDDENEEIQTICKIGTGFSDESLEEHTKYLKNHVISEPKSYYVWDNSVQPDVWFDAVQVWEIKAADLSISPVHKAAIGLVDPDKGISLRFPRFIRIRDDKTPEQSTSSSQVAEMYRNQQQVANQNSADKRNDNDDGEFY